VEKAQPLGINVLLIVSSVSPGEFSGELPILSVWTCLPYCCSG
jgi:hypothetical protein